MRKIVVVLGVVATATFAQTPSSPPGGMQSGGGVLPAGTPPAQAVYKLEDAFLQWPLPKGADAYRTIDGKHLHQYVVEQVTISRQYRDRGHRQYWGRIIGTSSDAESARWLIEKFKRIGLSDVRMQPFDLVPQWMPESWEITATGSGKTLHLDGSAQPAYGTPGAAGMDLEAVYAGTGSEADFIGRDVRGKAVFMFTMPLPGSMRHTASSEGAVQRAADKGAAAIFLIVALPGNMRNQLYPSGTNVVTFALGMEDGYAVRELMGQAPAGRPVRVKLKFDVQRVPGLKTSLVWGTLPGASDETIYVVAHRDGFFDAAGDNASGVASMIGLAEYYAKIPRARRRRTVVFVGLDGHHNSGEGAGVGRMWMVDHRKELFAKTALMINCEHPSTVQTYFYGERIRWSNAYTAQLWYAGGPSRPKLQEIAITAFRDFGVPTYAEPEQAPPPGDLGRFWRFVPGVATSDFNHYFHTDGETAETVPWTGLEATTRAYARIVDEVNRLDLTELQRPEEPVPAPGSR